MKINDLCQAVGNLPCLPTPLVELMKLDFSDDLYYEKVLKLTEQDPTFAVRVINLANSAASCPISQITTLQHAIMRLGVRQVQTLMTTYAIAQIFIPRNQSERNLWVHSIQVATASREIAKMSENKLIEPEQAYLCGLMHDIGRFILFSQIPEAPTRVDEHEWSTPPELISAEESFCGLNHAVIGQYACIHWSLPDVITAIVACHHSYEYTHRTMPDKVNTDMLKIIQMADYFSMLIMRQPDILSLPASAVKTMIEEYCIHPSWQSSPIQTDLLQKAAVKIYNQACSQVKDLGISVS